MPALKTDAVNVNDPDVVKALLRGFQRFHRRTSALPQTEGQKRSTFLNLAGNATAKPDGT